MGNFNQNAEELLRKHSVLIEFNGEELLLYSRKALEETSPLRELFGFRLDRKGNYYLYKARFSSLNAFILRYSLTGKYGRLALFQTDLPAKLKEKADLIPLPEAFLEEDGKSAILLVPRLKPYLTILSQLDAYPLKRGYRIKLDRVLNLEELLKNWKSPFPKPSISVELKRLNHEALVGFDGSLESLRALPPSSLHMVSADVQVGRNTKDKKVSLADKLEKNKIRSLYDLLFYLPKRYIDKSKPQLIDDLIEGESATLIGEITSIAAVSSGTPRLIIKLNDATGNELTVVFWRQTWLKRKFKIGDQVIITGQVTFWKGKPQLSGGTLELFDEGLTLPVVPIYKQKPSIGLTTRFFMGAIRELLQRMGDVKLPVYFRSEGRLPYKTILTQLHLPENLNAYNDAVLALAYYELIYQQLIIQDSKQNMAERPGIALGEGKAELQKEAIKAFPYELTGSQRKAVDELNKKLAKNSPSSTLLMADVGAGKTLVAQLAALRAVEAGYQAVMVAPTEVLARQIYKSSFDLFQKLSSPPTLDFFGGSLKAKERKELLARVESGETKVLVATQAAFSKALSYHNLGLVIIDEQQKFGAEQRSVLLSSRSDGRIPDLLLQTATPIPRSTAQIYYGDLDFIEMKDKPAGRLPIATQWIREDPVSIVEDELHPLWLDVAEEASKGHQTFVITPMVIDSDKVDAASVMRSYKILSERTLSHLRVGYAHGQMKQEEIRETMEKFRRGELDVLVASTVVEVGVDIPHATRMVILSAERMGASSLHQIRGRVGRNSFPSKCYLVSLGKTENSQIRLNAMVEFQDGFEIAKIDLETRGEGTLFSSVQAGRSDMIFANLAKHGALIEEAKEEALRILRSPFREQALSDAKDKYMSEERLF